MLGSEYVIDHVIAEANLRAQTELYRLYTSDVLKVIAESLGIEVYYRYTDMTKPQETEEKTGDEIALEVIRKLGLKINGLNEAESEHLA